MSILSDCERLLKVSYEEIGFAKRVSLSSLNSDRFIGLFRETSKDLYRLTEVGIRGCENDYIRDGDIPVIINEGMEFGDELVLSVSI